MNELNNTELLNKFIADIIEARKGSSLYAFVGAGVSISQGFPNWNTYVELLIQYWKFKINDLVKMTDSKHQHVELIDLVFLNKLSKSQLSNKRKVDLVYQIISKYCEVNNNLEESEKRFKESFLSFERTIFDVNTPINPQNEVIETLMQWNSNFITTNYDSEIRRSFKRIKGYEPRVIDSVLDVDDNVGVVPTIIHLHGTPNSKFDRFVSSSTSYENLYYINPTSYRDKINYLFKNKTSVVVIFIGCSLEEDEVLSMIRVNDPSIKYYALMKFDGDSSLKVDMHYNTVIQSYYKKNKNISFIWYGSSFNDLPKFIDELSQEVESKLLESFATPKAIKDKILSSDNYEYTVNLFNEYSNKGNYRVIDNIFLNIQSEDRSKVVSIINAAISSNLFKYSYVMHTQNYPLLWEAINSQFNFLTPQNQELVANSLRDVNTFNRITFDYLLNISLQFIDNKLLINEGKISWIQEHMSFMYNSIWIEEITDDDVLALWLIDKISNQKNVYSDLFEQISFTFAIETLGLLKRSLEDYDKKVMYSAIETIKDDPIVEMLIKLISNNRIIDYNDKSFPHSLMEVKLIQRIFVFIDLSSDYRSLSNDELSSLSKLIDSEYKYYGSEMNHFVKKHAELFNDKIKSTKFVDGISAVTSGWITELPFFKIEKLDSEESVVEIINRLKGIEEKDTISTFESFNEHTISEQNNEFIRSIDTEENWKNKKYIMSFIDKLIIDDELIFQYERTITKLLLTARQKEIINSETILGYLDRINTIFPEEFSYSKREFFQSLIDDNYIDEPLYKHLFEFIDPCGLVVEDVVAQNEENTLGLVSLVNFINTSLGRYYTLLKKVPNEINATYKDVIKQSINSFKPPYNDYLKGMFFHLYEDSLSDKSLNVHVFTGFSHNYRMWPGNDSAVYFKEAALKIIGETNDELLYHNLSLILLDACSIDDISSSKFDSNSATLLLPSCLNLYRSLGHDDNSGYETKIIYILNKYHYNVADIYISNIVNHIDRTDEVKSEKLIALIDNVHSDSNFKLDDFISLYTYRRDNLSPKMYTILLNLIEKLLMKNWISQNYNFLSSIEDLVADLNKKGLNKELDRLISILQPRMLPEDFESHVKKFILN